jgi:2Fe-2S ferredoxin
MQMPTASVVNLRVARLRLQCRYLKNRRNASPRHVEGQGIREAWVDAAGLRLKARHSMAKVLATSRSGELHSLCVDADCTLMEAIRDGGIAELQAVCGGCCSCATCHVYIDPAFVGRLPPMTEDENGLLDGISQRRDTSRLACQIRLGYSLDGLKVIIAPEE